MSYYYFLFLVVVHFNFVICHVCFRQQLTYELMVLSYQMVTFRTVVMLSRGQVINISGKEKYR